MTIKEALLATIAYADVFDYPLTISELATWLIIGTQHTGIIQNAVESIPDVRMKDGYVYLKGKQAIVKVRKNRERFAVQKMALAERSAALLKHIPTIVLVGVTGGLAMKNADEHDDIDLYIATTEKTMWVTRFLATVLLEIYAIRRKPNSLEIRNKICLNMYVDKEHLAVPVKERDLFSAHEVLQLVPLWDRDGAYDKFISANWWVKKYLPKARRKKCQMPNAKCKIFWLEKIIFIILEPVFRWFQLWYMRKRRSSEVVNDTLIRFHPKDARVWVMAKYAVRLGKYNIPLDKIFFGR